MVGGATRNDPARTSAFRLLCVAVCLSLLVVCGRAWAEEAPAKGGQDAATDIELVLDDVSVPTREAQDGAEAPSESLDAANSVEEPIAADNESDTDGTEASIPDAEDQSKPYLITQDSDSTMQDNGIPTLRLSIDPDEYQNMINSPLHEYRAAGATISIDVPDGYTGEFSTTELPDLVNLSLEYIRGRGNSTWQDPKHPFRFKLDKKANLLGMGNGKHWVLLANSYDDTLLRNRLTSYLGRRLGLDYTPKMEPVDLYVNDEYTGSYVLTPQVRIDDTSVAIDELGPDDTSEPEVSGGYLLALRPYDREPDINRFTTSRGVEFLVNDPDFSEMGDQDTDVLQAQRAYITAYLQSVEDALFADTMANEDGVSYADYMDLHSAAAYWWVQELSMNSDGFITPSTYLYKKRDGKLCWGPLWDFDMAYDGNWLTPEDYESLTCTWSMKWLDHMCVNDANYQQLLRDTWRDFDAILDDVVAQGGVLDQYAAEIKDSWMANQRLWSYDPMSDEEAERHFNEQIEVLRNFLKNRQAGIRASVDKDLGDRCRTVRFIVDDTVVKTVEVRRGGRLDAYDYPPDPRKEGYYFLEWRCEGEAGSVEYHNFDEDRDVYAVFKPDEEITRPKGLFFALDDVWVDSKTPIRSNDVVIVPSDVIDRHLTWTSSDPSVADVLPSGYVKVRKVGETVLTCTSSNGLTASYTLHVYDPNETKPRDLESFELESDRLELKVGQYGQVKANLFPQPARDAALVYQSSDESIASVHLYGGVVEGVAPGTCTITVRDVYGKMERQYTVVVTGDVDPEPEPEPQPDSEPEPEPDPEPEPEPDSDPEPEPQPDSEPEPDPDPEPQPDPDPEPQSDSEPAVSSTAASLFTSGDNGTWSNGGGDPLGVKSERLENDTDGAPAAASVTSTLTELPKTGDDSTIGSMVALCVCGFVSFAIGLQVRRRC